jgi:hypothetical protein
LLNYLLVGGGVKEWRVSVLVSKTTDQTIWYGAKVLGTDLSNAAGVYSGFKLALLYDANSGTVPTSLTDYSGNNSPTFNGNNATSNTTGFINGGLFYNGAQSLRTNTGAINAITGAVSIVSMYHSTTSTAPGFIASNDNGTNGYGCYSFSNGLTMQVVNGGSESDARFTCPGGSCLGAGTWHSVACVYNGGNATLTASWKLYLDGISQSFSMAATGTTSTGTATTNLVVGAQGTTASNFVSTNLDDTLVYNGALSADFITAFDFAENNPITISLPATAAGPPPHRARES